MIAKKFKVKLLRQLRARHAYCLTWDSPYHRHLTGIIVLRFGCKSIAHLAALSALRRAEAGGDGTDPIAGEFMGGTSRGADFAREELITLFTRWIQGLNLPAGYLVLHVSLCGRVDFHLFTLNYDAAGRTLRQRAVLTLMKDTVRPLISELNDQRLARGQFSIANTTARGKPYFAERAAGEPTVEITPATAAPAQPVLEITPAAPPPTPAPAIAPTHPTPAPPRPAPLEPTRAPTPKPVPTPADSTPSPKSNPPPPPGRAPEADQEEDEETRKKREAKRRRREEDDAEREKITASRRDGEIVRALVALYDHLDNLGGRELPLEWREQEIAGASVQFPGDDFAVQYSYAIDNYVPINLAQLLANGGQKDKHAHRPANHDPAVPASPPAPARRHEKPGLEM